MVLVDLATVTGRPEPSRLGEVLSGDLVPEALAWSRRSLVKVLGQVAPSTVVCVTARSYDAVSLPPGADVVLDLVDVLSENYRMRRNRHASPGRRLAYAALTGSMQRFEQRPHATRSTTAAGFADADRLAATWVPNVVERSQGSMPAPSATRRYDLLFHGNLRYEPNVEALMAFRATWQVIQNVRPGTTLLIAGARPRRELVSAVSQVEGWTLLPDFESVQHVVQQARVGIAPLLSATGFQNKVLETAAHGMPQIVSPASAAGLDPDFPVLRVRYPREWVDAVSALLDHPQAADELGRRAHAHLDRHYRPECYAACL